MPGGVQAGVKHLLIAALTMLAVPACTTERIYASAQGWQRNQCMRIADKTEYDRCMASTGTSYDSYKRQSESGQ